MLNRRGERREIRLHRLAEHDVRVAQDAKQLAEWVVYTLRRAGAAKVEDGVLVNRDF